MDQVMQNNLAATAISANGFMARGWNASNGPFPSQPEAFSRKSVKSREVKREDYNLLGDLAIEHPMTIAYVSSCQQDNCLIYVGPQIANLGFAQEAWLGKQDLRLKQVHKDDLELVKAAMQHCLDTSGKLNCQYRLFDSTGKVRWIHEEASVVCDESGQQLFVVGAMRDITDMKEMEKELNEHRYLLEKKVEQRTEQLMRRISLLESCNASLCDKLAQARRDLAALQKQLASAVPNLGASDCLGQVADIGEGAGQRIEVDVEDGWIGLVASA